MSHDMICSWLGLPAGAWPPDHYRLLGLRSGETDTTLIEQRVQQRLDAVRRYQMMHPDQATEAMNRLAQALICLTEPASKQIYDESLQGRSASVATLRAAQAVGQDTSVESSLGSTSTVIERRPAHVGTPPPPLPQPANESATAVAIPPPLPPLPTIKLPTPKPAPVPEKPAPRVDPVLEAARSGRACHGLATRRALVMRRLHTRKIRLVWEQLTPFLDPARTRLSRAAASELDALLTQLVELLRDFPPPLGQAGQPGYLVLSLAQQHVYETFPEFNEGQREALKLDWSAGQKLLEAHQDYLAQESQQLRRLSRTQCLGRWLRCFVIERPGTVLLLLALLAISVAVWQTYVAHWSHPAPASTAPAPGHHERVPTTAR